MLLLLLCSGHMFPHSASATSVARHSWPGRKLTLRYNDNHNLYFYILLLTKRVCLYMHSYVPRFVCLHVRLSFCKGVACTNAVLLELCSATSCSYAK